jgi:hypothetical protein
MRNKYFYISLRFQAGFKPEGQQLLKRALPYRTCKGSASCKKPATKWVFKQGWRHWADTFIVYAGKYCEEHAMWRCKDWNSFYHYSPRGIMKWKEDATKAHKNCTRCIPTKEDIKYYNTLKTSR